MKIEISQADLTAAKIMLAGVKNAIPRITSRSINKTLTSGKGYAATEVAKHYNLTQTRIKKDLYAVNATVQKLSGSLVAKGKPISLPTFRNTRQVLKGVSVQIKLDNPRWVWRHAFIRVVNNAKQAWYRPLPPSVARSTRLWKVWKRSDKYGVLPRKYRYGTKGYIYRLTGPRIEDELGKDRTIKPVQQKMNDRIQVVADQEFNYELSKL